MSLSSAPKFAEARETLQRINRMVCDSPELWRVFSWGSGNYLQMHQLDIFMSARDAHEHKVIASGRGRIHSLSRIFFITRLIFLRSLALCVSLIAIVRLLLLRPRVFVYSPDKASPTYDFRIGGLYEYLAKHNIAFMEVFHTTIGQGFFTNLKKRSRSALYIEAFDVFFILIDRLQAYSAELTHLDDSLESRLVRRAARHARRSKFRIRIFTAILKVSGIKTFLAIDDPRSYLFELIAACKAAGITTHVFQHGAYCKYITGWIDGLDGRAPILAPDRLYVWSVYWRKELIRLDTFVPQANIFFASNPKSLRSQNSLPSVAVESHQGINILMPYETAIPKAEVWACVERLLACPEVTVYFKPRPDKSIKDQIAEYGISDLPERFVIETDLMSILLRIDFVIGVQTTLLYEMIEALKPAVLVKSTFDYSEGMAINGIVDVLDPAAEDMATRVKELSTVSREVLEQRRELLVEGSVPLQEVLGNIFSHVRH